MLFALFPAGIHANNAVRSLPGRNPVEQRCSLTSRPEFARTTLFAYFPIGIRTNSAVRLSPDRNLREQRCLWNCRQEPSKTWINDAERVSIPAVLVETTEF